MNIFHFPAMHQVLFIISANTTLWQVLLESTPPHHLGLPFPVPASIIATFVRHEAGRCNTWPAHCSLLFVTLSLICLSPDLQSTSSFVILSLHMILRIFQRHLWWKLSKWCDIFTVLFHISLIKVAVGTAVDMYRWIYTCHHADGV